MRVKVKTGIFDRERLRVTERWGDGERGKRKRAYVSCWRGTGKLGEIACRVCEENLLSH